jgi:hypothetical protein
MLALGASSLLSSPHATFFLVSVFGALAREGLAAIFFAGLISSESSSSLPPNRLSAFFFVAGADTLRADLGLAYTV